MKGVDVMIVTDGASECGQWAQSVKKELKVMAPNLIAEVCSFSTVHSCGYTVRKLSLFFGYDEATARQVQNQLLKDNTEQELDVKFIGVIAERSLNEEPDSRFATEPVDRLNAEVDKCKADASELITISDFSEDVAMWWSEILLALFKKDPYTLSSMCSQTIKITNIANGSRLSIVVENYLMNVFKRQMNCACTLDATKASVHMLLLNSPDQALSGDINEDLFSVRTNHGKVYVLFVDTDIQNVTDNPYFTHQYGRNRVMEFISQVLIDMHMIQASKTKETYIASKRHARLSFCLDGSELCWKLKPSKFKQSNSVFRIDEMRDGHGWTTIACANSCEKQSRDQCRCIVSSPGVVSLKVTSISQDNVSVKYKVVRGNVLVSETEMQRRKEAVTHYLLLIMCVGILSPALWLCLLTPIPWILLHSYVKRGRKKSLSHAKIYFATVSNCIYVVAITLGTLLTGNLYVLISLIGLIVSILISIFIVR